MLWKTLSSNFFFDFIGTLTNGSRVKLHDYISDVAKDWHILLSTATPLLYCHHSIMPLNVRCRMAALKNLMSKFQLKIGSKFVVTQLKKKMQMQLKSADINNWDTCMFDLLWIKPSYFAQKVNIRLKNSIHNVDLIYSLFSLFSRIHVTKYNTNSAEIMLHTHTSSEATYMRW